MSTTRPRHSVLDLFDPLVSTNTQDRDVPDADSDKENSTPPLAECSMTSAFFGSSNKQPRPASVVLKRRLVDVGDTTIDDTSMRMMLTDEDGLGELKDDENDTLTYVRPATTTPITPTRSLDTVAETDTSSTTSPRPPFAELTLDRDLTPVAQSKTYHHTALPSSSLVAPEILVSPPGVDSSITSVINAVNSFGASFAQPRSIDTIEPLSLGAEGLGRETDKLLSEDVQTPQIFILSEPPSDSSLVVTLETPTDSLPPDAAASSSISSPPPSNTITLQPSHSLRPNPPKTFSHDPKRRSIDLYSSFQLQLQSEDASFDLLNDKISFLAAGNGMDSFMSAMEGDDSFDIGVEEANMEAALQKMKLEENATEKDDEELSSTNVNIPTDEPSPKPVESSPMMTTHDSKPGAKRSITKRSSFGYNPNFSSPISPKLPTNKSFSLDTSPMQSPRASIFTTSPSLKQPSLIATPLAPARDSSALPPAVPALKIIKRVTRFGHGKTTLPGSVSSTEAPSVPESPAASNANSRKAAPATFSAGSQSSKLASTASGPKRAVTATSTLPPNKFNTGPRRIPIVNGQTTVPTVRTATRSFQDTTTVGPRRIPIAAPTIPPINTTEPSTGKLPIATGLRAPAKYGTGIGPTSALPRPASRLPAPTSLGSGKFRTISSTSGIGSGIVGTGKGIPTRRMMYRDQ